MLPFLLIPLALVAIVAAGKHAAPASGGGGDGPDLPGPSSAEGLEFVRQLAIMTGAPKPWQDFFVLIAQRESKGVPNVGRGVKVGAPEWIDLYASTGESSAATTAYEAHLDEYAQCWPKPGYTFGSGGLFAQLPGYGLQAFAGSPLICLHPWVVFDPLISMIMAVDFARRLTHWPSWQGTVLSLRVGWGNPSKMDDAAYLAERRKKYRDDAKKAGLDPAFVDSKLPPWTPLSGPVLFDALGGDEGWLPE